MPLYKTHRAEDEHTATHLGRLGLNPVTVARLREYAERDGQSLRELVRYILSDYAPAIEVSSGQTEP